MKNPDFWRERAQKTREKANRFLLDARERVRMLRIAEEYDRLAERAAESRRSDGPASTKQ